MAAMYTLTQTLGFEVILRRGVEYILFIAFSYTIMNHGPERISLQVLNKFSSVLEHYLINILSERLM